MVKKSLIFSLLALLIAIFISGCAVKRLCDDNKIVIEGSTCDGIVSIVNNKSMPESSRTQSYDLVCEDNGKQNSDTINVVFTKTGKIKEIQAADKTKAMGRIYTAVSMFSTKCEEGQVERCVTVCVFPQEGEPYCYYICVCTDR